MSMQELKDRLKELHANLAGQAHVDAELKGLLLTVDADIQSILERAQRVPGDADENVGMRVRQLGALFAAKHPHLEPIVRDLADILGRMGI